MSIKGINTIEYAWRYIDSDEGAQIDLVIDRSDNTINLCEMKFSVGNYSIDKKYEMNLRNKLVRFMATTEKRKSVQLTFVTTYGVVQNAHSGIINNEIILDDLFR